jgi:hypothetical protein
MGDHYGSSYSGGYDRDRKDGGYGGGGYGGGAPSRVPAPSAGRTAQAALPRSPRCCLARALTSSRGVEQRARLCRRPPPTSLPTPRC